MKRNRWYPSSRFNILGSGPPSSVGRSITCVRNPGEPTCIVVTSDSGVWVLGGVDNLSTILDEKKAGKRMRKKERQNESNLGTRMTNEQAEVILQCNSCRRLAGSSESFSKCGRCKAVYYCGRECQKRDWPSHRPNCTAK